MMTTKIRYDDVYKRTGIPFEIAKDWIKRGKLDTSRSHGANVILINDKWVRFLKVFSELERVGVFA